MIKNKGINYTYSEKIVAVLGRSTKAKTIAFRRQDDFAAVKAEQGKLIEVLSSSLQFARKIAIEKKTYKGVRYIKGLPCRGQRTHTNAKTSRKIKKLNNDQS